MLIHATTVAIKGRGVLLRGPSGSGKSDLALRLIDRGAVLVADDQTDLRLAEDRLLAAPPPALAGLIEVRGIGIVRMAHARDVPLALAVDLAAPVERLPEPAVATFLGVAVPLVALNPFESSAMAKVRLAVLWPSRDIMQS